MNNHSAEKREESDLAISLWRESELSQGAFCRREGISRSTFQHWRRRYDPTYEYQGKKKCLDTNTPKESFIPLEMEDSASATSNELEVIYANGVRIKCWSDISVAELQKLISLQAN